MVLRCSRSGTLELRMDGELRTEIDFEQAGTKRLLDSFVKPAD